MKYLKNKQPTKSHSIMGFMLLLVTASIAYSTAVIIMGVDGLMPKALIAPQAIFAVVTLIRQFTK